MAITLYTIGAAMKVLVELEKNNREYTISYDKDTEEITILVTK